jgi:hypothetical protein
MTFPVLSASTPLASYNLTRSLRFRQSATAYLSRTFTNTGNRQIWTWSGWVKRGALSSGALFGADGSNYAFIYFSPDSLDCGEVVTSQQWRRITTQVFRDPSAWYHIVFAFNSTQATAGNRIKLYVNGAQVTSFSTSVDPSLNYNSVVNTTIAHSIGSFAAPTRQAYLDGYLTEVNFIDGQQLTPSSFGSTNSTTGVWQPAKYTGTYGTNGFYLPFTDITSTTTLVSDSSGNGNNWTANNISLTAGATYDSMTDVPTLTSATAANFATLNPLAKSTYASMAGGNLNISWSNNASANLAANPATISLPSSGKWYFELSNASADGNNGIGVGICNVTQIANGGDSTPGTYYLYRSDNNNTFNGYSSNAGSGTSGTTFLGGAICGIAVDLDNGKFWAAINNTWQGGGSPAAGTSPGYSGISNSVTWIPFVGGWNWTGTATSASINFGQRPFSYTPPSGFVALNTYNLPASTVPNGASYMAATLYTGTLLSNTIANTVGSASFQPDLVWIKSRSAATAHKLTDSVRGVTKGLVSNTTAAETTDTQGLTAFGSTGFTVGTDTNYNNLAATYVAWQWKAGGTAVSNTNGTITSSVSANTTSGCSVVTYTGNATANATVGHGLGVTPQFFVVKGRSYTVEWLAYHVSTGKDGFMQLQATDAFASSANYWGTTGPTSSTFQINGGGGVNNSGSTYVAYCFTPIKGFSAFGSYTGNGSTDGPFVYTGFLPRFVMVKCSSDAESWIIVDSARDPNNDGTQARLFPDTTSADSTVAVFDFLSNGFKNTRGGAATPNVSGRTYIYMAFAQNPFQNALAY